MTTTNARRALIIVDVQNDFCEGGSLPVTGGLAVAERIATYLHTPGMAYDLIVASRDWHTPGDINGGHFPAEGATPDYNETWPVHCVADTYGALFAPPLAVALGSFVDVIVSKGMGEPAYSAFHGVADHATTLTETLRRHGIEIVDVCGIATDYCVKATALDALAMGFTVNLLPGLHAGVAPETTAAAIGEMAGAGVSIREGIFR
jgi:nicotinamidase/pyrazinamidase